MKRGQLQLKHVAAFRAVITGGSASAAARALGLSQPAVSKIVAQAEDYAGIRLFDRQLGRLIPTPLAYQLYNETNVLFSTIDHIDQIVSRVINSEVQPIALGSVPLIAVSLLPKVLPDWQRRTGRSILIYTYDTPNLLNVLATRRLEIGVAVGGQPSHGLETAALIRSPIYCAVPKDHPLAQRPLIRASDLDGVDYVSLSRVESAQAGIDRMFLVENARPNEVMQAPLMAAAIRMAEEGVGVTLTDVFGMDVARRDRLVYRRFEPAIFFDYFAVWPKDREADFDRDELIALLRQAARGMLEDAERLVDAV
ncbi:LysR family transcriptional regulator [Caballeronia sp. LZ034LL]|uniref:LysR family transcriptional regulator n=1 Tax=Caballeronia sp. LZ034LL TaxID=3038567 RepID=UPI0028625A81|nr:LysR family transcriptional regulator [Caballeronia sp. LZ034LL]MDR5835848.1 LysR family transcriptional regulator [Caballeronia sp. LZ034LL]